MFHWSRATLVVMLACAEVLVSASLIMAVDPVQFDVPAIVIAQEVAPGDGYHPRVQHKLIRLRVPISTVLTSEFTGFVHEYFVEIVSPHRSMRMIDLWPRNELVSTIEGNVAVELSRQRENSVGVDLLTANVGQLRNGVNGSAGARQSVQQRFEQKPPVHLVTASGTTHRGSGVFFKFRSGPIGLADGMREVALLAEVPDVWRADLLEVRMRAVGTRSSSSNELREIGTAHAWIAVIADGDPEAAEHAEKFVRADRKLRSVIEAQRKRLQDQSLPTVFHRIGAALELVQPLLPVNLVDQALFGDREFAYNAQFNRLPVDVRVAILEFWDIRDLIIDLAVVGQIDDAAAARHVALKPVCES